MRIKFRLEKVKKYHGSSGYSPMSHLWGILGRPTWDPCMWWTKQRHDTHSSPSTSVSPVNITPPILRTLFTLMLLLIRRSTWLKKNSIKLLPFYCLFTTQALWLLYVPSRFTSKNPTFCQQKAVHVLYDSHKQHPLYTMCAQRVYCAVRTASVHAVLIKFYLQRIQTHTGKHHLHKTLTITKCIRWSYQFRT